MELLSWINLLCLILEYYNLLTFVKCEIQRFLMMSFN